jgi:hypothetical protein
LRTTSASLDIAFDRFDQLRPERLSRTVAQLFEMPPQRFEVRSRAGVVRVQYENVV